MIRDRHRTSSKCATIADVEPQAGLVPGSPAVQFPDPYPALLRAAQRAREIARQTNTPLVIYVDGKTVLLDVGRIDNQEASQGASQPPCDMIVQSRKSFR